MTLRRRGGFTIVTAALVVIDLAIKAWAVRALDNGPIELPGPADLQPSDNDGIAFDLFDRLPAVLLIAASLLIAALLVRAWHAGQAPGVPTSMVVAGAIANSIDRLEKLLGELHGGIEAWASSGRPVNQIPIVGHTTMADNVIDVRQANEYETGHLPGAANIELGTIIQAATPDREVTVMCGHGERAVTAASRLTTARANVAVSVFDGGPDTWAEATGNDLETGS